MMHSSSSTRQETGTTLRLKLVRRRQKLEGLSTIIDQIRRCLSRPNIHASCFPRLSPPFVVSQVCSPSLVSLQSNARFSPASGTSTSYRMAVSQCAVSTPRTLTVSQTSDNTETFGGNSVYFISMDESYALIPYNTISPFPLSLFLDLANAINDVVVNVK